MPKIIAIITEYNPFHNGHKYQIEKIREENEDAIIVSIMSGNVVQRGEFAIFDKYTRAEMAINCGVDAVVELPYPYSGSTSEIFAYGGVRLANDLGADILYFGTETADINKLIEIADAIDSEAFERAIKAIPNYKESSYPELKQMALKNMGYSSPKTSNDILAVEYIRQIHKNNYNLKFKSIKRIGAKYNEEIISNYMSASGIRKAFAQTNKFLSMPEKATEIAEREKNNGSILDYQETIKLLYNHIIMTSVDKIEKSFDCTDGMGYFIYQKARKAKNSIDFYESLSSKSFTTSRIKRTILYSIFDIKKIEKTSKFLTILLATNERGKELLRKTKKSNRLAVITKHSDAKKLNKNLYKIYQKTKKVDEIYQTLLETPRSVEKAYQYKPYIM